jgi:hypothetical protein
VEKGKAGGGLCYGYDVVKRTDSEGEPVRGERRINEAGPWFVRRIFREFAAGRSPRAIATDLNRDGIPCPFGHTWGDTTIRGHACRGNGIVNNELYAGVLVWNRQRFIKDPKTGKRVSRPNPEAKWIRTEVELRIVDDELWQRVKLRAFVIARQEGKRRDRVSAVLPEAWAAVDRDPAEVAPVPLALPRAQYHWPRKVCGARCRGVRDASEPNVQVGGTPTHGSLLAGLDRATGSRGIESIHVVDRSTSPCAGAESESSRHPDHMRPADGGTFISQSFNGG